MFNWWIYTLSEYCIDEWDVINISCFIQTSESVQVQNPRLSKSARKAKQAAINSQRPPDEHTAYICDTDMDSTEPPLIRPGEYIIHVEYSIYRAILRYNIVNKFEYLFGPNEYNWMAFSVNSEDYCLPTIFMPLPITFRKTYSFEEKVPGFTRMEKFYFTFGYHNCYGRYFCGTPIIIHPIKTLDPLKKVYSKEIHIYPYSHSTGVATRKNEILMHISRYSPLAYVSV